MHLDNHTVRELRLDRGWTQQQLADACGVSMRTIQRVEKDGIASLETTAALGAVFEVERRALLRISSPEEIKTVPSSGLRLVILGALLGFLVGVIATLALVSGQAPGTAAMATADPFREAQAERKTAPEGADSQIGLTR